MALKHIAPFLKNPLFTRDSFLKAPDWRWQLARLINNQLLVGFSRPLPTDVKVLFAARIQKALKNPKKRQFIELKMPDTYQICILGTTLLNAPLRCLLLACLIDSLTPIAISLKLKWITPTQVSLYKDLFFDLSGVQGLSGWFLQMLLVPIKGLKGGALFRARAIAHYFSVDAAIKSIRFGKSGRAAKLAMTLMWKDLRSKRIFDYMAKNLNVPILVYTNMMLQAIQSVLNRDFTLQLKGLGNQNTSVLEYASAILQGIRGFTQALINASNLKASKGVDASNIYLKSILLGTN